MSDSRFQLTIQNAKIESSGDGGDWVSYDVSNTGTENVTEGALVAKYEALCGSDSRWSAEEILAALPAGQALTVTQRLGEGLEDGDYVVWVTMLDGSDTSPAFVNLPSKVTGGRFTAT